MSTAWPEPKHRNAPWIYKITSDYVYKSRLRNITFESKWLLIYPDGRIVIKGSNPGGYAWDGCTPKFNFLDLFIFGIPDGATEIRSGKPKTYYASLVHDALCQYMHHLPITRREADKIFLDALGTFKLRWIYYFAVRTFGRLVK